ncbi:MAG: DUF5011 domain-containing protein [Bacteroidales bacterium]|nr:DUF5011 domain-containing protein [Bacteroidales bacterium]
MKKVPEIIGIALFLLSFIIPLGSCNKKDANPPEITVHGSNPANHCQGTEYDDAVMGGATAYDEKDGNLTGQIVTTVNVNIADTGIYYVNYSVTDSDGNKAEASRTVHVIFCK